MFFYCSFFQGITKSKTRFFLGGGIATSSKSTLLLEVAIPQMKIQITIVQIKVLHSKFDFKNVNMGEKLLSIKSKSVPYADRTHSELYFYIELLLLMHQSMSSVLIVVGQRRASSNLLIILLDSLIH